MKNKLHILIAGTVMLSSTVLAKIPAEDAKKLGNELTPVGAVMSGNGDRTIPGWKPLSSDVITKAQGQTVELYADEKPLFTIDQSNYLKYSKNLTPGQVKLFKTYPTYKMNIYPSHRNATYPQAFYDNTKKFSTTAELTSKQGNGITGVYNAVPFPMPQSGLEAIWNHLVRYQGVYKKANNINVISYDNGSYATVNYILEVLQNFNIPGGSESGLDNILFYYKALNVKPAQTAGQSTLIHETIDQIIKPRGAWSYNPGRRRVRRSPSLAYDQPIIPADGLRTVDDTGLFNGSPDRFNWELKGKKEIFIPYNNEKLVRTDGDVEDFAHQGHPNPEMTRYELHRVWEVEATLREGMRHIYSKRTLYLDEDTWTAAISEQYDNQNELWRVSMAYLRNAYSAPAVVSAVDVYHDLQSKRYFAHNMSLGADEPTIYSNEAPSKNAFTPNSLRQRQSR